jgi:membrane protein YqaA with SNARE-associated domain
MQERLKKEQEEKEHKKKEKAEAHLYTIIKVFLVCFPRIAYFCCLHSDSVNLSIK